MSNTILHSPGYRIKTVANITGLSTHVIRKWEERYLLLTPLREPNGYRQYDEEDIQLLLYLQWQMSKGHTIGELAHIGRMQLRQIMNECLIDCPSLPPEFQPSALTILLSARRLDRATTESAIHTLVNQLGLKDALYRVLFPTLRTIGELWHQGQLCMTSEHLVTQTIRHHLANTLRKSSLTKNPTAIIACAPHNFHEIGAMTTALLLQNNGWNSVYLGVNSDIDLIRLACQRRQGKLVILSTLLEQSPKEMNQLIRHIKKKLLPLCPAIIGGRGAIKFREILEEHGIIYVEHVHQLQSLRPSYSSHPLVSQQHLNS
ncbi:MAG: HTH-type transcriptional repressor CarH [Nitrospirales bacterium]|nr:MAG: HTH-type transcriptional repressor CarH [Nitrospirales bacterium]